MSPNLNLLNLFYQAIYFMKIRQIVKVILGVLRVKIGAKQLLSEYTTNLPQRKQIFE